MKAAFRILALAACIMIACSMPASSATLKPGTYKLEWTIPDAEKSPVFPLGEIWLFSVEKMKPEQIKSIEGLASEKPYFSSDASDRLTLIIDESKGTGKGYDIAYLIPGTLDGNNIKLSQHAKIPLNSDKPVTVMVPFGKKISQVSRQVALIVEVSDIEKGSELCIARALGNWTGRIKTDSGEVPVYVTDTNGNGVFNDKQSRDEFGTDIAGDFILVGDPPKDVRSTETQLIEPFRERMFFPNQVNNYGGKLYTISINETGDTLEVQPYEGPSATLKLEIRGSNNKPMSAGYALLSANESTYFNVQAGKPLLIPSGTYQCKSYTAWAKPARDSDPGHNFTLISSRTIQASSGQTTLLSLGGPVSVGIAPGPDVVEVDLAKSATVNIVAMVGPDRFIQLESSGSSQTYRITDTKGILACEGSISRCSSSDSGTSLAVSLPRTLRPATYWLEVTINTGTYQKPVTAKKQLIVK